VVSRGDLSSLANSTGFPEALSFSSRIASFWSYTVNLTTTSPQGPLSGVPAIAWNRTYFVDGVMRASRLRSARPDRGDPQEDLHLNGFAALLYDGHLDTTVTRANRERHDKAVLWFSRKRRPGQVILHHRTVRPVVIREWSIRMEQFAGAIWQSQRTTDRFRAAT
jgi:hypothetical protein